MEENSPKPLPRTLFKFTSVEGAKAILRNQAVRFSSPILFNDPFDCQLKVKPGFKHGDLTGYMRERVKEFVRKQIAIPNEASSLFRQLHAEILRLVEFGLSLDTTQTVSEVTKRRPQASDDYYEDPLLWDTKFRGMRIAALSETNKPIIMWSHYADHHRGICLEFNTKDTKSFFSTAQEVMYSNELPSFATAEQFGEYMLGLLDEAALQEIFRRYLLRKSPEWSYESEWRVMFDQPRADELFADLPINVQDLNAIYFGVRTSERDQQIIKSLCYKKYSVEFWNGRRSDSSFAIEFEQAMPF